jgi:hypothetical protein
MGQLLGTRESLLASLEGLIWIAKRPQDHGRIGEASHPGVLQGTVGVAVLGIVERDALLEVLSGRDKLSEMAQSEPQHKVGTQEMRRVVDTPSQSETLLSQFVRCL